MKNTSKAPTFKRGDEVTWTSQASGYVKKKLGVVVEVVTAGHGMSDKTFEKFEGTPGAPREHRSYIVKTADGKLYWPLVKYLRAVKSNGKGK